VWRLHVNYAALIHLRSRGVTVERDELEDEGRASQAKECVHLALDVDALALDVLGCVDHLGILSLRAVHAPEGAVGDLPQDLVLQRWKDRRDVGRVMSATRGLISVLAVQARTLTSRWKLQTVLT